MATFENQGQVCSAGSRIYVHQRHYDEFVQRFTAWTSRLFLLGDPLDPQTTMGPLVSTIQQRRVLTSIEHAKDAGARLAFGGGVPSSFPMGAFVEPTLFLDVRDNMPIVREDLWPRRDHYALQ